MSVPDEPLATSLPDPGPALCLSGGGFRATLFHLGALQRLNELGVLSRLATIISVSGGSILNGIVASRWNRLEVDSTGRFINFNEFIVTPTREFCSKDLRTKLLLLTRLDPTNWGALVRDLFAVSANYLAKSYEALFEKKRLVDLSEPAVGIPRFVFCATGVQSGACWQFHSGPSARMGDFYVGYCAAGQTTLAEAVAASSAFPPGFSALRIRLKREVEFARIDPWGDERPAPLNRNELPPEVRREILLTDGGVYDNLGVEPVWNRCNVLLISDAGRPFLTLPTIRQWAYPRLKRASDVSMEQVGAVRKRWLLEQLSNGKRRGAIWTLGTHLQAYPVKDSDVYTADSLKLLQQVRTDLNAFTEGEIACLVNHGYTLADAATRSYVPDLCSAAHAHFALPHPEWTDDLRAKGALQESATRQIIRDICSMLWQRE